MRLRIVQLIFDPSVLLLEQFNLSFPAFTYEGLALPRLRLQQESSRPLISNEAIDVSLSVQVPALRASLDCKHLSPDHIEFSFNQVPHHRPGPEVVILADFALPDGCGSPTVGYNFTFTVADGEEPTYYVPDPDNGWCFAGELAELNTTIQSSDCQSLAFLFGSFKMNVTSHENVTVMSCSERVQASTTFILPNLTIQPAAPPVVDEVTAKILQNATSNLTALRYSAADRFRSNFVPFYSIGAGGVGDQRPLDIFFQALTLGSDAVPPSELVGADNADRLLDRVNHLYGKYMAQLINTDMRTAPLYPHPTYNASIALPTARLRMNNGSKITLQILLAVMFVCGSLAYSLTDMRHTLPHNPHSIAGTMTLLAGSEMCSRGVVPNGAEWLSDRGLKKAGVFEGYVFSLGWWEERLPDGQLSKRRFGIDVGRAEKSA